MAQAYIPISELQRDAESLAAELLLSEEIQSLLERTESAIEESSFECSRLREDITLIQSEISDSERVLRRFLKEKKIPSSDRDEIYEMIGKKKKRSILVTRDELADLKLNLKEAGASTMKYPLRKIASLETSHAEKLLPSRNGLRQYLKKVESRKGRGIRMSRHGKEAATIDPCVSDDPRKDTTSKSHSPEKAKSNESYLLTSKQSKTTSGGQTTRVLSLLKKRTNKVSSDEKKIPTKVSMLKTITPNFASNVMNYNRILRKLSTENHIRYQSTLRKTLKKCKPVIDLKNPIRDDYFKKRLSSFRRKYLEDKNKSANEMTVDEENIFFGYFLFRHDKDVAINYFNNMLEERTQKLHNTKCVIECQKQIIEKLQSELAQLEDELSSTPVIERI